MAESILRLKLDCSEYDSKIKRATDGLLQMEKECRSVGGTLAILDKEQLDFVEGLGKMETKSQSARGKVAELKKAYEDLRSQYNRLTQEEKSGDYGKALKSSLEQIKTRLQEGREELRQFGEETKIGGGLMDTLSEKFGVNLKSLSLWGAALAAGKGALEVLKTAINNNESAADEWGATVRASEGLWNSFCNSLASANFGSFFSNINNVIESAREAYQALDDLSTIGGVLDNQGARLEAERARQKSIIKDKNSTPAQKAAAQKQLEEVQRQKKQNANRMYNLNSSYIRSELMALMDENNLSEADKKKAYPLMVASLYSEAGVKKLNETMYDATRMEPTGKVHGPAFKTVHYQRSLGNVLTDSMREKLNPYVQAAWNYKRQYYDDQRADQRVMGADPYNNNGNRNNNSGGKTPPKKVDWNAANAAKGSLGIINSLEGNVNSNYNVDLEIAVREAEEKWRKEEAERIRKRQEALGTAYVGPSAGMGTADLMSSLMGGVTNDSNPLANISDEQREALNKIFEDNIKQMEEQAKLAERQAEAAKKTKEQWNAAAGAISKMGSALASVDDPALNIAGTIMQAIANVALSYTQALNKEGKMSAIGWIAFAASGLATMLSTIAAIKQATAGSYANGGVIGGSDYNDGLSANVSTGEVIFNRTDAGKLYDYVHNSSSLGGGEGNMRLVAAVSGSDLRLVINNDGRSRGVGKVIA